ncbi:PH domain-containing protein [Stenotrophomonas sp. SY1]|uniref:PH domain-containing protein n=1 Tax=Stenotrophomonas sp. SY1 TaxID=477235 RepID=UPI001E5F3755|nr:PH domain-containing protein [Stenotrophomonas sp. SY1]MCD9087699.1 PH domain-containing protein [Stenotrophomonas sp. SY1]
MPVNTNKNFSIGGLNGRSLLTLAVLVAAIVGALLLFKPNVPLPAAAAVSALVVFIVAFLLASARVTVLGDHLVVGAGFYKVKVPLTDLLIEDVKELPSDSSFKLRWRTNGLGWPGLSLGWFSTNGEKSVFAAISSKQRRIYIPLRGSYDLVVTPESTDEFLSTLRSLGRPG